MISISKKHGVNIVLTCFAYRDLHTLSGVLAVGSEVEIAVTSLSERQILRISGADLASVPDGLTKGGFSVLDSSGNEIIRLMLEFDVVPSVSYTGPVREIVCVAPHIPPLLDRKAWMPPLIRSSLAKRKSRNCFLSMSARLVPI